MSNERKYYPYIIKYLQDEFRTIFQSQGLEYIILGEIDTLLAHGIMKVCDDAGVLFKEVKHYTENLGQLNVDVFLIVINPENKKFEVIISEVKDISSMGLKEYSQLMGYCLSSYSKYGLLINVNNGVSKNLNDLLLLDYDLSTVNRIIQKGEMITHQFGVFKWNSINNRLESLQLGKIHSLSEMIIEICDKLK